MNIQYQRHSVYLQRSWSFIHKTIATASLLGLCLAVTAIAEPLINRDRTIAFAENNNTLAQLSDILAQAAFGDDQLTRYAAAANAIENKRLEIFRAAKNNSNWIDVANLAESQHTKVCDLSQPPDFLVDLCSQLRSFTEKEIRRQGFTNKEFNQITREQRQNPYLRGLIQSKQMQLRNSK
ncbi:DUF4168 domain-containing protein [Pseudanabaena sp. FACHB-1998]|uniref:DUF4168 domain-containing protein n=1 Tax=Pseudanabaena sp. FACHB-1998 TaxID=2692858 RepID=UPI0016801E92|nr:DUF4168 domain-containing protein [Pseudanabaena sp. FACHB-1998]MBD2178162.1 DUF4168 domain-containing protein [Pseudanabaena sp. FACHB-1998]